MQYPKARLKLMSLAVASACAATAVPAYAQQTIETPTASGEVQTVVVTGIRSSMASSLNMKRNSDGIVDGIVAEDIGKFPDTNLAESLQRISGVSIDRSNGEGSKITVRGVGPDFNLVLLNGRQMPTSNLGDRNGRAFDFANIASEAISQIQVYKTSRAETPTGGIGASVNVMTARPLSTKGTLASVGVKAVHDTSGTNLPGDVREGMDKVTPEISGIYSTTSADGMWGVSVSGSYQERNAGFNQASVAGGWRGPFKGDENNWGTIPNAGTPAGAGVTNHPKPGDVYSVPQNINYNMNGFQRQRTNGQLVLQFAPNKDITTTLDYTYSENKIQTRRQDLSAWFNFGPSTSSWGNGPVAAPLVYTEILDGNGDIAMGAGKFATKTANNSLGFNATWKVNNDIKLEFDAHKSTAESKADSPWGSSNSLGTASMSRGNTSGDFTADFPVLSIQGADYARAPMQVTGSVFDNGYMKGEVEQAQVKGRWKVMESSSLNFGVAATTVNNRSAFSNQQRDTWTGATKPSDYPASMFHPESLRSYFDNMGGGVNNPALFNNFFTFNFDDMRALAAKVSGKPELYEIKKEFTTDSRTEEKSKSAFLQINTDWDTALPFHTAIGVRWEKTDVYSTALVPTATGINWVSNNELPITFGAPSFTNLTGKYHHLLPSFDSDLDLRDDMKVRFSYGETIGRPRWDQIQGGQVLDTLARVNGGTGNQGNPALLPVKSKNLDLSYEWYYGKQNFFSVNYFKKDLENYAGQSKQTLTPFNLHTPVGGKYWNAAIAAGCVAGDTGCIRNYIFRNFAGQPGVVRGADDGAGNPTGTITGQPSDPIANFEINSYSNQKKADLSGAEVNVQHMFGNSGFGIAANYTYVHSGLKYNNQSIGEQFALVGLSDSANLVGIFENAKWSARVAYNWRDEFLNSTFDSAGPNPQYTEAYGQVDISIGYNYSDKLSFQAEVINATDEAQRIHGRTKNQVLFFNQNGPRYMIGARYKF